MMPQGIIFLLGVNLFLYIQFVSPKFTEHGKKRAGERGITPKQIDAILFDSNTVALPSKSDDKASIAYGMADGKVWAIVYSLETGAIITVRRADKKERRLYEQKGN